MTPPPEIINLLALHAMPQVAAALRSQAARILELWTQAVEHHIPDADPLTLKQVRDSIPMILEKIAGALESDNPDATAVLTEVGTAHGINRFQAHYNIEELIVEYRLLRRITLDQIQQALAGKLSYSEIVAVDMALDIVLQRGVQSYVRYLSQQLQSSTAAESKYLAFLSHDLRNNLSGIMLTVEWLSQKFGQTPEFRESAEDLASLQNAITETVNGMDRLLQSERLRKRTVTLKISPINLHRLGVDLISQVSRSTAAKGLRVENAIPPTAGAYCDRELVTLVIQNLLGNAIKYSSAGLIRLSADEDQHGWRISVSDQGPGIPQAQLATLFDAFTRGDTHGQPGIGLGLNIASHAARLLGAELEVQSTLGQGSTFSFTVPPARAEETL